MAENTAIEWATHTFNPWEGCQKVGPGCDHCYAETRNARFGGGSAPNWGPGAPRRRTSASNWNKPLKWQAEALASGTRPRVFCASLADVFDNAVDPIWRLDLAAIIIATPNLEWLLLTKRIGNVLDMLIAMFPVGVPANVRIGATIVNQDEAHRDMRKIAQVSVACILKPFLSIEPLLDWLTLGDADETWHRYIGWVIVGGESGLNARPMHPDWATELRDECDEHGVPFLFKQWGEWTPGVNVTRRTGWVAGAHWFDNQWLFEEQNLSADDGHCDDEPDLYRVGKKAAGRVLDGVTHDGYPS